MGGAEGFVAEHEPMVRGIAKAIATEHGLEHEIEDLVGWGLEGLLTARASFDESRGIPFQGFAYYRVRGAILDGVSQLSELSRRTIRQCRRTAVADMCAEATGEDLAGSGDPLDDEDAVARAIDEMMAQLSIATHAAAALDPERGRDPEDRVVDELEKARLRKAMSALPPREQRVLKSVYFEDLHLEHVGAELEISKSQASRIHTKALDLLREQLA